LFPEEKIINLFEHDKFISSTDCVVVVSFSEHEGSPLASCVYACMRRVGVLVGVLDVYGVSLETFHFCF